MPRFDDLKEALKKSNQAYIRDRQICLDSAFAMKDHLAQYVGANIFGFFDWRGDEVPDEKQPIHKVFFWDETDEPEMVVGLMCNVDTPMAFSRVGFRLSLRLQGNTVVASIHGEKEVELFADFDQKAILFPKEQQKDEFLAWVYGESLRSVSTPIHKRDDERMKFGFRMNAPEA